VPGRRQGAGQAAGEAAREMNKNPAVSPCGPGDGNKQRNM